MTVVIGRTDGQDRPSAHLGEYRALDGSGGARFELDIDGPHAMLVLGKRGSGKSYTLGVLAEELGRCEGVAPIVVDPMGAFRTLADPVQEDTAGPVAATVLDRPRVRPSAIEPKSWCGLVGLPPESGAGGLIWQAAEKAATLAGMAEHVRDATAPTADTRAAINHIRLAQTWDVFDPDGLGPSDLGSGEITVLDLSGLDSAPMNAVLRAIAEAVYRGRVGDEFGRFPWVLVDEAHTFLAGIAEPGLRRILVRGRMPGVSLVLASQRPADIPAVAVSQSDVIIAHRLTSKADREALAKAHRVDGDSALGDRLPDQPGDAVVVDDATETVHAVRVRSRHTPHGGDTPSVTENIET